MMRRLISGGWYRRREAPVKSLRSEDSGTRTATPATGLCRPPSCSIGYGLVGPGLLAHALVAKYADHQPLDRQSEIYAPEGVALDRSTLAGWIGAATELLPRLINAVRSQEVIRQYAAVLNMRSCRPTQTI